MADRKTVSDAYNHADNAHQKIDSHEELCAERYKNIHETLGEVKDAIKSHQKIAWGLVIAILGWMAVQMWNGQVVHPANPPLAAPAVTDPGP